MIYKYCCILGLLLGTLMACSINNSSSEEKDSWRLAPLFGPEANPMLTLKVMDSGLVVVSRNGAYILENDSTMQRNYASRISWVSSRWDKPTLTSRHAVSILESLDGIMVSNYIDPVVGYKKVKLDTLDSKLEGTGEIVNFETTRQTGPASEENTILLSLESRVSQNQSRVCEQDGVLAILGVQDSDDDYYPFTLNLIQIQPFEIYYIRNKRYYEGYFYLATSNGIARMPSTGGSLEWFLHKNSLYCDINPNLDTTLTGEALEKARDSLLIVKNNQKWFWDVVAFGDSLVALEKNGRLWISGDRGGHWDSTLSISTASSIELIRTPHFLGAKHLGTLWKFDIKRKKVLEVNLEPILNTVINDVAEFQDRLYLATDGGLFSKPYKELGYLK